MLFKFSMCFKKWICGKYFVLVTFQPLRGRQKYVVGKTDHPLAAGFQAHVQPRDNIEGGERERRGGFPVGEHSGRPIVQSVEQYFFHLWPSLSQPHFTFLQISTIFLQAFTSSSFPMTLPLCDDTSPHLRWHFNFASKVIVRKLALTPFLLSL